MELIRFIFSDFWVFIGACILSYIIIVCPIYIIGTVITNFSKTIVKLKELSKDDSTGNNTEIN
jgi:hypothetical protein